MKKSTETIEHYYSLTLRQNRSFWVGEFAGAKYELDDGRSIAYIGGSGSLGASSTKLISANWNQQKTYQRKAMGERTGEPHPSRGAISPFYGKSTLILSA
jgi:hypothetical protein